MRGLLVLVLVATASVIAAEAPRGSDWKDAWLREWEHRAGSDGWNHSCTADQERCLLPKHVAARQNNSTAQLIPRVIWQTWNSRQVGAKQHAAMLAWIHDNPEYDYYMFDDQDAMDFMCAFHATDAAVVYQLLVPGAAKADLWRLAIMQHYGGVYMDADTRPQTPLRTFIWPNASMVSGWGTEGDFHQWGLIYAPGHPIIRTALQVTVQRALDVYQQRKAAPTPWLTGPGALMQGARDALAGYPGCSEWLMHPFPKDKDVVQMRCFGEGVLQVFTTDMFGGHVLFKGEGVAQEMAVGSGRKRYQQLDNRWSTLFHPVQVELQDLDGVRVGQCEVPDEAVVQAWAPLLRYLVIQAQPAPNAALLFSLELGVVLAMTLLICLFLARWWQRRRRGLHTA